MKGGIIYEGVKTAFKEAVENLPQGELKTQLKKNFNCHLKKLLWYVSDSQGSILKWWGGVNKAIIFYFEI